MAIEPTPLQQAIADLVVLAQQVDTLSDQMRPVLDSIDAKETEIRLLLGPMLALPGNSGRSGNADYAHQRAKYVAPAINSRATTEMVLNGYSAEGAALPVEG